MDSDKKPIPGLETMAGDMAALTAAANAKTAAPAVAPVPPTPVESRPVPPPVEKKIEEPAVFSSGLQKIRTYQSDIAEALNQQKGTVVQIAVAEQTKRQEERKILPPTKVSLRNIFFIAVGILLILGALTGIGYAVYKKSMEKKIVTVQELVVPSPIHVENKQAIVSDGMLGADIKGAIKSIVAGTNIAPNTITQIYLTKGDGTTKQLVKTGDFMNAIGSTIPRLLVQSLDDTMTLGVFNKDSANNFFMVFHTDSYNTAFAGMLTWEPTMFDDLYQMFNLDVNGIDSSLFRATFKDKIIKNQDTRALLDASGTPVLFYTFLGQNKDTLIVTKTDGVLTEVLNRLAVRSAQ